MPRLLSVVVAMGLTALGCQSTAAPPPESPRERARVAPRSKPDSQGLRKARQQYVRVYKALDAAVNKGNTPLVKKVLAGLPVKVPMECRGSLHTSLGLHAIPMLKKELVGAGLQPGLLVVVGPEPEEGEVAPSGKPSFEDVSLCAFVVGRKSTKSPYGLLVATLEWSPTLSAGVTVTTRWKQFPKGSALLTVEVAQKPTKGRTVGDESSGPFARISRKGTLFSFVGGRFHTLREHPIEMVKPIQGDPRSDEGSDDGYERDTWTQKYFTLGSPPKHIVVSIERHETHKPYLPGTPSKDIGVVDRWEEMYMLSVFSPKLDELKPVSGKERKRLLALPALAPYRKEKSGSR